MTISTMTITLLPMERTTLSRCPVSPRCSLLHRPTIIAVLSALVVVLSLACCTSHLVAQPVAEITVRPAAPELRVLWSFPAPDPEFGVRAGGLEDIYGRGSSAWGLFDRTQSQWLIFRHDSSDMMRDTVPVQRLSKEESSWPSPIVGDFWGTGHKAVGFVCDRVDSSGEYNHYFLEIDIHRTDGDSIDEHPATVAFTPGIGAAWVQSLRGIAVADLNHDGSDELIVLLPYGTRYNHPEIWIYEGGPNFHTSYPTAIIEAPWTGRLLLHPRMAIGDFDGDHHPDIFLGHSDHTNDTINYLAFYWGNGTVSGYEDTTNRRVIPIHRDSYPSLAGPPAVIDWDGDGVSDLALGGYWVFPPGDGTFLYRSASGRSARTRSYRREDADLRIKGAAFLTTVGALNDTSRRAPMFAVGLSPQRTALFSHRPGGPDLAYDAHIPANYREGLVALPDADGDGWDDLMGRYLYGGEVVPNVVTIYAGGPYIPRDTATSHVEMIADSERGDAITAWPNPVVERLSIAWRGDMAKMPRRFTVHDMRGEQVAEHQIPPGTSSAFWECRDMAVGMYLVSLYAADGSLLARTHVVKHDTPSP